MVVSNKVGFRVKMANNTFVSLIIGFLYYVQSFQLQDNLSTSQEKLTKLLHPHLCPFRVHGHFLSVFKELYIIFNNIFMKYL